MRWRTAPSRTAIGLDVGARWIKAAQLVLGAEPRLVAAAVLPRDTAAAPDADASHALGEAEVHRLKSVLRRRRFSSRRIVAALPGACVLTSVLDLPPRASGAPLEQIARTELAHMHRREPATMEVAFWELPAPARPTAQAEGMPAMVAGCTHDDAMRLLDPLERRRFQVDTLDTQGWALARACFARAVDDDGMTAAVDLGWSAATLVLLHQGIVVYERPLPGLGLRALSETLQRDHRFPPDVVEFVLRDVGLDDRLRTNEARAVAKARGDVESHFDPLRQELGLAVSYAQHQYPSSSVRRIVLTGGGAAVPGLVAHLTGSIDVPVERLTPSGVVACAPALAVEAEDPSLVIAVGLALADAREEVQCQAA